MKYNVFNIQLPEQKAAKAGVLSAPPFFLRNTTYSSIAGNVLKTVAPNVRATTVSMAKDGGTARSPAPRMYVMEGIINYVGEPKYRESSAPYRIRFCQ